MVKTASSPGSASELQSMRAILHATNFAAQKHWAQKRKGAAAEPDVNHLLEVADLVSMAMTEPDTNLIQAALLHDVIEDYGVIKEELVAKFGKNVADLVMEVTDDKSLPNAERKRLQIVNAPKKPVWAQAIKLADKTSTSGGFFPLHQPIGRYSETGVLLLGQRSR